MYTSVSSAPMDAFTFQPTRVSVQLALLGGRISAGSFWVRLVLAGGVALGRRFFSGGCPTSVCLWCPSRFHSVPIYSFLPARLSGVAVIVPDPSSDCDIGILWPWHEALGKGCSREVACACLYCMCYQSQPAHVSSELNPQMNTFSTHPSGGKAVIPETLLLPSPLASKMWHGG